MWPKVINRRRQKYTEAQYLSDWQIHSAHLTAGAIDALYTGFSDGPIFVPMPTGSGKTTGDCIKANILVVTHCVTHLALCRATLGFVRVSFSATVRVGMNVSY